MEAYLDQLQQTRLFAGISPAEISSMLHCLQARTASYQKGDYVFRQGDSLDSICVPLEGSLLIQKDDYWGKRSIVNRISTGDMFGEAYVTPDSGPLLNDVIAATFWIPFNRQQLADFLSVDRSAMSNELCKMRDQGLLLFEKNKFTLL